MSIKTLTFIISIFTLGFAGLSQSQQTKDKTHPCQFAAEYAAFDFWLGDWEVYGNLDKTGPIYGKNSIKKAQNGCLLIEEWQGTQGSTGTSMNYYDGTKGAWVQHWVAAGGTVINIDGGLEGDSMILTGEIFYINTTDNPIRTFRGTWTPIKHGVVRQFFEESIDDGKTWKPWFEGFYFRTE
jgi:hypothetical protein